ncbi:hypothetical protein [Bacteroides sp.]|uniref:hypothetical protein n=1 Tax=Bacteroides sp. TaxID=29523 RepID=UPI00261B3945|nr:hypothetical protein [Bacteroides sp.]MDD3038269.1 hypothetical protein [Bacteroides sp.]
MSKVKDYIKQATSERVRSRGLIRKVATEAARIQRIESRRQAIEVYKQMCPSRNCKGCASRIHKNETNSTRCDGNCARIKYLINGLDRVELSCI